MTDSERIVKFPDLHAVETEAAEWVARLDKDEMSAEDYAKFQEWRNRSVQHREAVERLTKLWSDFDTLSEFITPSKTQIDIRDSRAHYSERSGPWKTLRYAAAACLVAMVAGGLLYSNLRTSPPVVLHYETAVGAQKTVSLPDGSSVLLNTNSRVDVTFSDERRDVRLARGEAYFEVVHNIQRPFTVYAGNGVVHDVGTAFDVQLLNKAVEVTVTKGNVEVAAITQNDGSPRGTERTLGVIARGQNIIFDSEVRYLGLLTEANLNRELAWREGVLVYAGEPLAKVIKDISRYTDVSIELDDPKLKDVPVGGYFEIDKINAVFEALEKNFGVRVEWQGDKHVRLFAARNSTLSRQSSVP